MAITEHGIRESTLKNQNELSLRDLWKNNKRSSICIAGVSETNVSRAKTEGKETIAGNFPNMAKDIHSQIQETEGTPNRINPKKSTPRHCITKLMKTQDKVFWSSWKEREYNSWAACFPSEPRRRRSGTAYTCLRKRTSGSGKTIPKELKN